MEQNNKKIGNKSTRISDYPKEQKEYIRLKHTFEPVYDNNSRILILGSFPSVKSRENKFYYGHKQNRFWKVLGLIYEKDENSIYGASVEEKTNFLIRHHIALWDVISECDIIGSDDSSIKNVKVNDINRIIVASCIEKIFVNGKVAKKLYDKYCLEKTKMEAVLLPSTSPANAVYKLENLVRNWSIISEI